MFGGPDIYTVIKEVRHHEDHFPDPTLVQVKLVQHAINKAAKETHNSPQVIIAEATANTSAVTAVHLPSPESLKRNIRRLRQEDGPAAQMPANLRDLVVPENLQVASKGDQFLLHDSGPDSAPNRFLIFGTARLFDLLVAAEEVYGDGTFTIPPILFAQLYLFNTRYRNSFITCLNNQLQ